MEPGEPPGIAVPVPDAPSGAEESPPSTEAARQDCVAPASARDAFSQFSIIFFFFQSNTGLEKPCRGRGRREPRGTNNGVWFDSATDSGD